MIHFIQQLMHDHSCLNILLLPVGILKILVTKIGMVLILPAKKKNNDARITK